MFSIHQNDHTSHFIPAKWDDINRPSEVKVCESKSQYSFDLNLPNFSLRFEASFSDCENCILYSLGHFSSTEQKLTNFTSYRMAGIFLKPFAGDGLNPPKRIQKQEE